MSISIGTSGQDPYKFLASKTEETVVGGGSWTTEAIKAAGIDIDGEDQKQAYEELVIARLDRLKTEQVGKNGPKRME